MKFTPKSDQEIQNMGLLAEGLYDFHVIKAEELTSKAGNEMVKLTLQISDNSVRKGQIFDYLIEQFASKLKQFANATGLETHYDLGEITSTECLNRHGKVHIVIEQGKANPNGGFYQNKNSVKEYLKSSPEVNSKSEFTDDSIPF